MSDLAIWWTDEREAAEVRRGYRLPGHLRDQFTSRHGRNGRGRLWVAAEFGEVAVDPWPSGPLAERLARDCAGIVFSITDLPQALKLPGLVTDMRLNVIRPRNAPETT